MGSHDYVLHVGNFVFIFKIILYEINLYVVNCVKTLYMLNIIVLPGGTE